MYKLRPFRDEDASIINELALLAFKQFERHYTDWYSFKNALKRFSSFSKDSEIIVAINSENTIIGAVAYVPADVKKADFFPLKTPIIRMLVVNPEFRGQGIGRSLSQECINRAARDGCKRIALHTSSIMEVALPMYLRMGFTKHSDAPNLFGVRYDVYTKEIA